MDKRYLNFKKKEKLIRMLCYFVSVIFLTGFYDPGINYIQIEEKKVELGEKVNLNDLKNIGNYLTNSNLSLEDNIPRDAGGHTTKAGIFNYYVVYRNNERMYSRITKNIATVSVVDTISPELKVKDVSLKFDYNSKIKPGDIVNCYDLSKCSLSFEKSVDTTKVGSQEVNIIATDESNNISKITVKITIKERPYYSSSFVYIDNHNASMNANLSYDDKVKLRNDLVAFAKLFEGNPYVWGGNSLTNGVDCSGFTKAVYNNFGYQLPRTAPGQGYIGIAVSRSQLLPGDIVVFHSNGVGYHVALYIGGNMVIHAGTPQTGIQITKLWNESQFYRRIIY